MKTLRTTLAGALALGALFGRELHAQSFTWKPLTAGTFDWNVPANWTPSTDFPDAPGDVANLDVNITGAQTVRLRDDIVVGTLNFGDASATGANFAFSIANAIGESFDLIFDSGDPQLDTHLNVSATGTPTNNVNVPVTLNSDLQISFAATVAVGGANTNSQRLTFGGGDVTIGSQTLTVTGGYTGVSDANQLTFAAGADLVGDGTIVNNGETPIIISNPLDTPKSFVGTIELNGRGSGGSNTGSLTLTSGALPDAAEFVINGFLSAGATQNGGSVHSGDNSTTTFGGENPGQRLTTNIITFNGGSLTAAGQAMNAANISTLVEDTVDLVDFNSAYSLITISANASSGGTRLNINSLDRVFGASAFIRSSTLGSSARVLVADIDNDLIGAGGDEGTTTMSIIPWMVAANANGSAASSDTFATSTATGIRGLSTVAGVEYATAITAGPDNNVSTNNVAVPLFNTSVTVNALRFTGGATASNIGLAKTLFIASGGLIFQANNGTIGASGSLSAGTVEFGDGFTDAEGIVWANGTNTNTIGASISGNLGLTKAGTGTLILTGTNTYFGPTYVGAGTLQVGDGVNLSNLGPDGDVLVANGALLSLFNGNAIPDDSSLTLEQFGLANGRINIIGSINEVVNQLFFGSDLQAPGTWGSSLSTAQFKSDTYFSGTGILTVLPEPGSAALILSSLVPFASLRPRRQRHRKTPELDDEETRTTPALARSHSS